MCSHPGHSNRKPATPKLVIESRDFDEGQWNNVMQKGHQLALQRKQQEENLDIQKETCVSRLIYPQSLILFRKDLSALKAKQTLKINVLSERIKQDLSAAARLLGFSIEPSLSETNLYITK